MRNHIETSTELKKLKKKKKTVCKSFSILEGIMVIKEKGEFIVLIGEAVK